MNQSGWIDSKLSLDGECANRDHASMITQAYHLYVERIDRTRNMARFYAMSIEPNLFGEACLTRRWGRIGTNGQTISHHFATEREAVSLFLDLLRRKKGRGYSTVARHQDNAARNRVWIEQGKSSAHGDDGGVASLPRIPIGKNDVLSLNI